MTQLVTEQMREKWKPVIESDTSALKGLTKEDVIVRLMENQEDWCNKNVQHLNETGAAGNTTGGAVAMWSPVLIKMVKRIVPNLVAVDFMGVQPLAAPDGLIFAMRTRYGSPTGAEAFYNEADSAFSGADAQTGSSDMMTQTGDPLADPTVGGGMTTAVAETLGSTKTWAKMGVSIEKNSVTAKSRGLYADYTHELRQDMMAVHGEDVDAILSDVLITEIQAEMNREFIRTMNLAGKNGAFGCAAAGVFNLTADTDGRWFLERLKQMMFQLELDANQIAIDTRRGKGNRLLCSANVASALVMAGMLDYTPALAQNATMQVDVTGQTFAGVLSNGMKVYIDPYATIEYYNIGYKGATELDAGMYFAPYTPLEMYRTVGEDSFNPRMAFKTRYGLVANPFYVQDADGVAATGKGLGKGENGYFRKARVINLF